jgi:hypothetical protein
MASGPKPRLDALANCVQIYRFAWAVCTGDTGANPAGGSRAISRKSKPAIFSLLLKDMRWAI